MTSMQRLVKIIILVLLSNSFLIITNIISSDGTAGQSDSSIAISDLRKDYKKIVVITWDGTRSYWMDELSSDGTLETMNIFRTEGSSTYIKIMDHSPSTNPGLTCIETGFGPNVTTIYSNTFGSSDKRRIPDGMQTSERLKSFFGSEFKVGHLNSWMYHDMNYSLYGLPEGHLNQMPMLDSIFLNAEPGRDVDFWFGSENISWRPTDPESHEASYDEFWHGSWVYGNVTEGKFPADNPNSTTEYGYVEKFSYNHNKDVRYWKTPLINCHYLARKATEFLEMYADNDFYLRIHMTEPDHIGHGYGESTSTSDFTITPEYKMALEECDKATGTIRQKLIDLGIYNDTIVIVGTAGITNHFCDFFFCIK